MAERVVVERERPLSVAKAQQRVLAFLAEHRMDSVVSLDADGEANADEVAAQLQRISRVKVADDVLFQLQQISEDMEDEQQDTARRKHTAAQHGLEVEQHDDAQRRQEAAERAADSGEVERCEGKRKERRKKDKVKVDNVKLEKAKAAPR